MPVMALGQGAANTCRRCHAGATSRQYGDRHQTRRTRFPGAAETEITGAESRLSRRHALLSHRALLCRARPSLGMGGTAGGRGDVSKLPAAAPEALIAAVPRQNRRRPATSG